MNTMMKRRGSRKSHIVPPLALMQLLLVALLVFAGTGGMYNLTVVENSTSAISLPIFATTNGDYITNYLSIDGSMTNSLTFQIKPSNQLICPVIWNFTSATIPSSVTNTSPDSGTANTYSAMVTLDTNNFPTNLTPVTITSHRTDQSGVLCPTVQTAVNLLPVELAVDANRDGTIVLPEEAHSPANIDPNTGNPLPVDTTSQDNPYRFWLNEDQDDSDTTGVENLAPYDGVNAPYNSPGSYTPDYTLGTIHTKRNLEDFARLWIYIGGLQTAIQAGTIKVALQWKNVTSGSPAINVYKAYESDGGSKYLTGDSATDPTDDSTAAAQIADDDHNLTKGKITGTSPVVLDKSLFSNLSSTNPKTYCLFEGAGVGTGELVMVFEDSNGNVIGQGGSLYLDIRHVTDMYEQVQGQAATEPIPQPTAPDSPSTVTAEQNLTTTTIPLAAYTSNFTPDANETSGTIVWVHGWNVYPERYEQQTQAMFKRLWWVGFKGRFASYRWPSTDGEVDEWPGTLRTLVNGVLFDQIEYRAYKYASGLKTYIASKAATGNVYVVAHSLGAVIASEALKRGAPIAKLELMDSAVSASCYDTNIAESPASDPDLSFHTDGTVNGGYRGYFQNLPAGKITSFFNVQDSGVYWWTVNNGSFKGGVGYPGDPIVQPSGGHYYNSSNDSGSYTPNNCVWSYQLLSAHGTVYNRYVPDIHESMALMAFSRSGPLGYESTTTGPVGHNINMQGITLFGGAEQGHSPQMDENIQHHVPAFFQTIMTEANLNPTGP